MVNSQIIHKNRKQKINIFRIIIMKGQASLVPLVAKHPLILLWEIIIPQFSFRETWPLSPTPPNSQTPSYRYYPVLPVNVADIYCNMGHGGLSWYISYISLQQGWFRYWHRSQVMSTRPNEPRAFKWVIRTKTFSLSC